ncbi:hypothetical protein [Solitalea lacus]|uniref:hypothetical protein n=1 Tax=Solitalea lacus TaxID=2911172 RepID=UPI001EDB9659|nr:hypothetical protein [Solitalea lacus]UKJ08437.1 hypothetical protein L2B55_04535 [Solitalea lacus]
MLLSTHGSALLNPDFNGMTAAKLMALRQLRGLGMESGMQAGNGSAKWFSKST